MKNFIILLSLFLGFLGFLISAPNAYAIPLYVGQEIYLSNGPGDIGGGEFGIHDWNNNSSSVLIHSSFCLETNESIQTGSTHKYMVDDISSGAVQGGAWGGNPDPLNPMTAFLFYNFYKGTLTGYDHSPTEADKLQKAMWYIEEEYGEFNVGNPFDDGWNDNDYVEMAWDAVDSGAWVGLGLVRVVNLTDDAGAYRQDQLTVIPEPATMLLLGTGLIGLAFLGRKKLFKK